MDIERVIRKKGIDILKIGELLCGQSKVDVKYQSILS